eukprot:CCRYP_008524-RA/>CCRYP_008524-RA protein AED:0.26 eAED:0.26 QI:0/0/0/1/1/1/2/0/901
MAICSPNEHRINAAERAIRNFKNHFISGLCSTDCDFPSQLWDKLLQQAQDSLNMLHTSRIDPTKSAYEILEGPHDFNQTPWAPPGCRAILHEPVSTQTSWGPCGTDAWYLGPAMHHYQSYEFYIPETRAYRISASAKFFPSYCNLPTESPLKNAACPAAELIIKLHQHRNANDPSQLSCHQRAMKIINNTYQLNSQQSPRVEVPATQPPRVETTLSSNPTAPRTLCITPQLHNRVTRNNTLGLATSPTPPCQSPCLNPETPTLLTTASPTCPSLHPHLSTPPPQHSNSHENPLDSPTFADDDEDSIIIPLASIPEDKRGPINVQIPHFISQEALQAFVSHTSIPSSSNLFIPKWQQQTFIPHLEHFANPVVHPVTGQTLGKYEELANDPVLRDTWTTVFGKELGALAQGDNRTGAAGTNTIFFMTQSDMKNIPSDQMITYTRVMVDYRPQKEDPNRVRIMVGGNLIDYPDHIIDQYQLRDKVKNGYVYMEIRRAMYGLPQAGILTNKLLKQRLAKHGYYEVVHTSGLLKHISRPVSFTLVVDDFGIKYVGKEHADHLLNALKQDYMLDIDWTGMLYCGISLKWDYDNKTVNISMPGYIKKVLQRFRHECWKPQHSPYHCTPKQYGKAAQLPLPLDESTPLDKPGITRIQQIVGAILYYVRCVDITILLTLSTIAHDQAKATQCTNLSVNQPLDYCATHPNATVCFRASDMVLNIHSDASYLNAPATRSRIGGHFFLGWIPRDHLPIKLNGAIHVISTILKFVAASAAEAELGALFVNAKEGRIICLILHELGHPQPPTPIHCDNSTAASIANNTVKRQRSRSMEMCYFWITDQVARKQFAIHWHPGLESMGDYYTKHHPTSHHQRVCPYYLFEPTSPLELPQALTLKELRGCAKIPLSSSR